MHVDVALCVHKRIGGWCIIRDVMIASVCLIVYVFVRVLGCVLALVIGVLPRSSSSSAV